MQTTLEFFTSKYNRLQNLSGNIKRRWSHAKQIGNKHKILLNDWLKLTFSKSIRKMTISWCDSIKKLNVPCSSPEITLGIKECMLQLSGSSYRRFGLNSILQVMDWLFHRNMSCRVICSREMCSREMCCREMFSQIIKEFWANKLSIRLSVRARSMFIWDSTMSHAKITD